MDELIRDVVEMLDTYLGDASDHVVDQATDGAQASNVFPASLPYSQGDHSGLALHHSDIHIDMTDILGKSPAGAGNADKTRLNAYLNVGGNFEFFGFEDVPHLRKKQSQRDAIQSPGPASIRSRALTPAKLPQSIEYSLYEAS